MKIINCFRKYNVDATIGTVYINGCKFGYTLEDVGRPNNVKIGGETCIPEGIYRVTITHSNRFKRDMLLLTNPNSGFTGVRVHGGNTVADTEGCPLIAGNTNGRDKVWGSLESELLEEIKGHECYWVVN